MSYFIFIHQEQRRHLKCYNGSNINFEVTLMTARLIRIDDPKLAEDEFYYQRREKLISQYDN